MRILGIDHGARSGWSVIDDGKFVDCGFNHISGGVSPQQGGKPGQQAGFKLSKFNDIVTRLIYEWKPDMIATEQPKDRTNAMTSQTLIGYYSITMFAAYNNNIPVNEVNPKQMKKVITGSGNADKSIVAEFMAVNLGVPLIRIKPVEMYKLKSKEGQIKTHYYDESDACALAYFTWLKFR